MATAYVGGESCHKLIVTLDHMARLIGMIAVEVEDVAIETHTHEVLPVPQAAQLLQTDIVATPSQIESPVTVSRSE